MVASGKVIVPSGGGGGPVAWSDVSGKPSTFPPTAHTHAVADITGLVLPTWTTLTGKPTTFAPAAHSHVIADTTGLQAAIDANARIFVHNGTAYVVATDADIYVGAPDPGAVPNGSVWIH